PPRMEPPIWAARGASTILCEARRSTVLSHFLPAHVSRAVACKAGSHPREAPASAGNPYRFSRQRGVPAGDTGTVSGLVGVKGAEVSCGLRCLGCRWLALGGWWR